MYVYINNELHVYSHFPPNGIVHTVLAPKDEKLSKYPTDELWSDIQKIASQHHFQNMKLIFPEEKEIPQ